MATDRRTGEGTRLGDPLGRAMLDHHRGDPGRLVYRDGTAVQDGRVASHYFTPRDEWTDETVADLERLAESGGPIVDVGCGTGQHARWFQDRGVEAVGVDVSPNAAATARARGVERVLVGDMRDLPLEAERFEALHCVGTQLALGGSLAGITEHLAEFGRVTTGDAVALVDNYDPARLDGDVFGSRPDPREGIAHRCFHFEYRREAWPRGVCEVGPTLHFLLCSPDRLREAVRETSWRVVDVRHTEPRRVHYRATLAKAPTTNMKADRTDGHRKRE